MLVGAFLPTALLILLSAALGFFAAWFWRGRQFRALAQQNRRLRKHRQKLGRIHANDQARLVASQANQRIAEEELAMLNQAHAALEADHAKLVTRHANLARLARGKLKARSARRKSDDRANIANSTATNTEAITEANTEPKQLQAHLDLDQRTLANGSGTQALASSAKDARVPIAAFKSDGVPKVAHEHASAQQMSAPNAATPDSETASDGSSAPAADDGLGTTAAWFGEEASTADEAFTNDDSRQAHNDLEVFSAQLASASETLTYQAGNASDETLTKDSLTTADAGEDGLGAIPDEDPETESDELVLMDAAASQLEAMEAVLDAREKEIDSLRKQLAPLLGLPLAVSTREAERDRLAKRLAERDAELAALRARSVSTSDHGQPHPETGSELETRSAERVEQDPVADDNKKGGIPPGSRIAQAMQRANERAEHTGRLSAAPPSLHSEVPLADLLNEMKALDGLASDNAGTPSTPQRTTKAGPKAPRDNADDVLESHAWPDSFAVREWQSDREADRNTGDLNKDASLPASPDNNETSSSDQQPVPRQYEVAPEQIDDLKNIIGIGPVIERQLNRLGVYQLRQIAAWTDKDVAFFDMQLDEFGGRITSEQWVSQAQELDDRNDATP